MTNSKKHFVNPVSDDRSNGKINRTVIFTQDNLSSNNLEKNFELSNENLTTENKPKLINEGGSRRFLYKADSSPPFLLTFFFGLQQVMVSVSVLVSIPFIVSEEVCPGSDLIKLRVVLISGTFVVCGIATILQTALGFRLALLQGIAFAYVPSVRAFMSLPEYRCNATIHDFVPPEEYKSKMALLQGTLLLSSLVTMTIGATGLVGRLTKYIGPLTVSSLMFLLMFSGVELCVARMEKHWISLVALVVLFNTVLYFSDLPVPIPGYKDGKFQIVYANLFGQFPYLITIAISWIICLVLTKNNFVEANSVIRTDRNETLAAIEAALWFKIPEIGQFGMPQVNMGLFVGYLVSAQTTLFEAVGNYHAVARVSEERPPPSHAINRGILSEGLGCFISGLIGPGIGITTHAENVGVVGITGVASRITMIFGGFTLIVFGISTKLGALLSSIPEPLVGVVLSSTMAMVGGVAVASCSTVDMNKTRNVSILGFSIMLGMCVPKFYERNPNVINTGINTLDQIIKVLLSLPMFVGAFSACILDNTVNGATRAQRGLRERGLIHDIGADGRDVYSFPKIITNFIQQNPFLKYLPFLPKQKIVKTQLTFPLKEEFKC